MAVTYVPDTAPVRQKMLFASTRLTLVRELGSEHFRDTIFATTAKELTPAGFDKHDAHTALDAPLTEEEKSLGEVKRAEQEAGSGTGIREIHLSKTLNMPVSEDALAALKDLGAETRDLVMLVRFAPSSGPTTSHRLQGSSLLTGIETTEDQHCERIRRARPRQLDTILHLRTRADNIVD